MSFNFNIAGIKSEDILNQNTSISFETQSLSTNTSDSPEPEPAEKPEIHSFILQTKATKDKAFYLPDCRLSYLTKAEVKFNFTSTTSSQFYMINDDSTVPTMSFDLCARTTNGFDLTRYEAIASNKKMELTINTPYTVILDGQKHQLLLNGELYHQFEDIVERRFNKMGATITHASDRSNMGLIIYYIKIWQEGVLDFELYPAKDKEGNICLWDNVQNRYYYTESQENYTLSAGIIEI